MAANWAGPSDGEPASTALAEIEAGPDETDAA